MPNTSVIFANAADDNTAKLWTVGATAQGAGTRNVMNIDSKLEFDITGIKRRRKLFDIGAYRYVVTSPQAGSVGDQSSKIGNLHLDSSLIIRVTNHANSFSIGELGERLLDSEISTGDTIVLTDNSEFVITEVLNDKTFAVSKRATIGNFDTQVPTDNYTISDIRESFTTPTLAIAGMAYPSNFVSVNTSISIILCKSFYRSGVVDRINFIESNKHTAYNNSILIATPNGKDNLSAYNQRINYFRDDSVYSSKIEIGIAVEGIDYTEISGLYLNMSNAPDGIYLNKCNNATIDSNFIFGSFINGIKCEGSNVNNYLIFNNIIDGGSDSSININVLESGSTLDLYEASYLEKRGNVCIINNTVTNGTNGLLVKSGDVTYPPLLKVINNISKPKDANGYTAYSIYNRGTTGKAMFVKNISSDRSPKYFTGSVENTIDTAVQFSDYPYSFFPNTIIEKVMPDAGGTRVEISTANSAIDNAVFITDKDCMPLSTDAAGNERDTDWDNGGLEVIRLEGVGFMLAPFPYMTTSVGVAGDIDDYFTLYLRRHKPGCVVGADPYDCIDSGHTLPYVNSEYQFPTIDSLNAWVNNPDNDVNLSRNLVIYAEGGEYFPGKFSLGDRSPKWVSIQTQPGEENRGPASIIYTDSIIDDTCFQSELNLTGLRVYNNNLSSEALIDIAEAYNTGDSDIPAGQILTISNCIVEVNKSTLVVTDDFAVKVFNSNIVYRNSDSSTITTLTDGVLYTGGIFNPTTPVVNPTGPIVTGIYNSIVLTFNNSDMEFTTTQVLTNMAIADRVMLYNYGDGNYYGTNLNSDAILYENINPEFEEFKLVSNQFNPELAMDGDMELIKTSTAIDSGDNSYVNTQIDIAGIQRIYLLGTVDLGAHESRVHSLELTTDNIFSIEQKKLFVDNDKDALQSADLDKTYKDAYTKFDNATAAEEFVRESNMLVELKSFRSEHISVTDKLNKLLVSMPAVLDIPTKTIIVDKNYGRDSNFWSTAFKYGRYRFHFDEIKGILSVYVHDTYNKGLSGKSNVVNNVRFSGTRMVSE
jgi:hypothetical protein